MINVEHIKITNFRGIKDLTINFQNNVNIIVANNGVGKSAILDCLAIMLSRLTSRVRSTSGTGRFFSEYDIMNGESETSSNISIKFHNKSIPWGVTKKRKRAKRQSITNMEILKKVVAHVQENLENDSEYNLPLAVYYPVNRAVVDIPLRIKMKHPFDQLAAYDQALTGGRNDFRVFFEWFRNREDYENEVRLESQNHTFRDNQLEAVRAAIEEMLPGFNNLRIRRNPLRMTINKGEEELKINQLSDGEKCLLALVGDLARRLAIANPSRKKPLQGDAVVLIDEIDLHLHPAWQREIIPKLEKTFPNCQFILTTHSPQILSHVQPECVYILKNVRGKVSLTQPDLSFGMDSSRILEDIMGTDARRGETKREFSKLFNLLDKKSLPEARSKIEEIENKIKYDVDLTKAKAILHRLEILGK